MYRVTARLGRFVVVVASIAVGSCAQQQIEFQSSGFNRAIEQTTNELLLLNVVRSSQDLPIYFTKLTKYTGQGMASGSVQPKFPFGPKAAASYDLGIITNWNSGVSSMEFADLNQSEGLGDLRKPVEAYVYEQYYQAKFPWMVLATILFDAFEVSYPVNAALVKGHEDLCGRFPDAPLCVYTKNVKDRCGPDDWVATSDIPIASGPYGGVVAHLNNAKTACDYWKFQSFLALLVSAGFVSETQTDAPLARKEKSAAKSADKKGAGNDKDGAKDASTGKIVLKGRFIRNAAVDLVAVAAEKALTNQHRHALAPRMRSPRRMIEFLGELTALQNYSKQPFVAQTVVRSSFVTFWGVARGDEFRGNAAVSVRDPRGETFSVVRPELGSEARDQSLVVLSLVNELINLAISKDAYPPPSAVEVRIN